MEYPYELRSSMIGSPEKQEVRMMEVDAIHKFADKYLGSYPEISILTMPWIKNLCASLFRQHFPESYIAGVETADGIFNQNPYHFNDSSMDNYVLTSIGQYHGKRKVNVFNFDFYGSYDTHKIREIETALSNNAEEHFLVFLTVEPESEFNAGYTKWTTPDEIVADMKQRFGLYCTHHHLYTNTLPDGKSPHEMMFGVFYK